MPVKYKTIISSFELIDDRVEITMQLDATFELSKVQQHFQEVYQVIKTPQPKTIIDFRNTEFANIPKETMKYMAKNEYTNDSTSVAIIVNGLSQKLLGNFYLRIFKPQRKTRIFNKKEPAAIWLDSMLTFKKTDY